ncbi:hypothetical protein D3C72_2154160 [compost metagenome]
MAAWLTNRSLAESKRQSAGIMSPADSTMMSPCTSWRIGSSICWPLRSTVAVLLTMAFRRSAARFERPSCTKRSRVERITMVPMTMVAFGSSVR